VSGWSDQENVLSSMRSIPLDLMLVVIYLSHLLELEKVRSYQTPRLMRSGFDGGCRSGSLMEDGISL
jgi:hypothetical protein